MSIHSELQEFREFALEEQVRLNASVNPGQYVSELINEKLDPMLIEIIGSRTVALFGNILVPAVDEDRMMAYDIDRPSHVFGTSNGVYVCKSEDYFPDAPVGHLTLGYSVILGRIEKRTLIEARVTQFYAFGPVLDSWLEVPDLRADSEVDISPEDDDDVANRIKDALEQGFDPDELSQIFDSIFDSSDVTDQDELPLRVVYYLDYLNSISGISDFVGTIRADQFYEVYPDGIIQSVIRDGFDYCGEVNFSRFDYSARLHELCLVKENVDSAGDLYFPLSEITEAEFTVKSNADSI